MKGKAKFYENVGKYCKGDIKRDLQCLTLWELRKKAVLSNNKDYVNAVNGALRIRFNMLEKEK